MTVEELQSWLEDHIDQIFSFMDYEPTIESDEDLADTLRYWFDREDWNDGQKFVHLGIDGMGSQIAAWLRPAPQSSPVVYFGSEGGRGVLVRSTKDWAQMLAYAPYIDEYPGDDEPACLVEREDDDDLDDEAQEALADYRAAVTAKFGGLSDFSTLTSGLEELNDQFTTWVESRLGA